MFNRYFKASQTLELAPDFSEWFSDPRDIKVLTEQRDLNFKLDAVKMQCSREKCRRRTLCFGARAIKERGGSSYGIWDCYRPQINKAEVAEISRLVQLNEAAKAAPKKRVKVSPSFTSRQKGHLRQNISPMKKVYLDWENKFLKKQAITVKIRLSYADQPHCSQKKKCKCHD